MPFRICRAGPTVRGPAKWSTFYVNQANTLCFHPQRARTLPDPPSRFFQRARHAPQPASRFLGARVPSPWRALHISKTRAAPAPLPFPLLETRVRPRIGAFHVDSSPSHPSKKPVVSFCNARRAKATRVPKIRNHLRPNSTSFPDAFKLFF